MSDSLSWSLSSAERNYNATEREYSAEVWFVKLLRPYLQYNELTLYSDSLVWRRWLTLRKQAICWRDGDWNYRNSNSWHGTGKMMIRRLPILFHTCKFTGTPSHSVNLIYCAFLWRRWRQVSKHSAQPKVIRLKGSKIICKWVKTIGIMFSPLKKALSHRRLRRPSKM